MQKMKVFEIDIKPTSDFATPLQGDSLFGHLCWQFAQDNSLAGKLESLLEDYQIKPFAVIADPIIRFVNNNKREYLLKRPFIAPIKKEIINLSFEQQKLLFTERKRRKGAKWVIASTDEKLEPTNADKPVSIEEIRTRYNFAEDWAPLLNYKQNHNSIDRYTGTTGTGSAFAPYTQNLYSYNPGMVLTIFVGIDDKMNIDSVLKGLKRIGQHGYGADATSGKGKFELTGYCQPIKLADLGSNTPNSVYTLSTCTPEKEIYSSLYFEPFVRFGRHGNYLANSDYPFKQPVLKADTGAVFKPLPDYWPSKPYIGKGLKGLSKYEETVEQAYSLYIPVKTEATSDQKL
jgi:CRISPR-associated protein Csm4